MREEDRVGDTVDEPDTVELIDGLGVSLDVREALAPRESDGVMD